ncbi:DHH family phosphoesterase [Patescibacteria group bacterium]|nr:DHH family phosphoesterase [Patescibacteria group bacterium]MBU4512318.1 DHH family phosphoesterase [Patescibacteria group bacterium]MCG2693317.1 DHH family phosphoesterase [Candidatus Parcubacteria bacterium]
MENQVIIDKIKNSIDKASKILLVCHRNPDGDTLGAALSLAHFLETAKKGYALFCQDSPADFFRFLSKFEELIIGEIGLGFKTQTNSGHDLIITLDCGDIEQTGLPEFLANTKTPIVNIDHHITNTQFGDYNLVDADKASTTALLYQFFTKSQISISRNMATCLLVGLLTDTGNFSNPATNSESLAIAARLVARGAQIREINKYILQNKSIDVLKLWSRIFLRLQKISDFDLAWTVITQKDLAECGIDKKGLEGVANFLSKFSDSAITLILEELENKEIKGSLRTNQDFIDVSKFAKLMGGGGHAKAAGFRINGQLLETAGGWEIV